MVTEPEISASTCPASISVLLETLSHFDMTTYPFGGHHADEITKTIRASLGASGKKATMPKDGPGKVTGEQLASILAWADAFDRAHPSEAHDHGHGHRH